MRTDGYSVEPVDTLVEFPGNPRRGDVEAIRESIRANGFVGALLVQTGTRHVLSGNHTLQALRAEGVPEVPVTWADIDDDAAARVVLAMNRAADLGYYDDAALANLLLGFGDADDALAGTLYAAADVDFLTQALAAAAVAPAALPDPELAARVTPTPSERTSAYEGLPIRTVMIPLTLAAYEEVVAGMVALRAAWDLDSNAEVVVRLVEEATAALPDVAEA